MKAQDLEPAYPVPVKKVSVLLQVLHDEMPQSSKSHTDQAYWTPP
jgi:hypothetical protein